MEYTKIFPLESLYEKANISNKIELLDPLTFIIPSQFFFNIFKRLFYFQARTLT
jgi:hypothetical protein